MTGRRPDIGFDHWYPGLTGFYGYLESIIESERPSTVCEIGGGASPLFPMEFVEAHGIDYTIMDISQDELDKAPPGYRKVHADVTTADPSECGRYDLMFSHMVAEHVRVPQQLHGNVRRLLSVGGLVVHLFPTLYEPAFVINRLLPERLAYGILARVQPSRATDPNHGKFPAHYRWCRGPTRAQIRRLEHLGYEVVGYEGYFGTGYVEGLPVLGSLSRRWTSLLLSHPTPLLTSFARVTLKAR